MAHLTNKSRQLDIMRGKLYLQGIILFLLALVIAVLFFYSFLAWALIFLSVFLTTGWRALINITKIAPLAEEVSIDLTTKTFYQLCDRYDYIYKGSPKTSEIKDLRQTAEGLRIGVTLINDPDFTKRYELLVASLRRLEKAAQPINWSLLPEPDEFKNKRPGF